MFMLCVTLFTIFELRELQKWALDLALFILGGILFTSRCKIAMIPEIVDQVGI